MFALKNLIQERYFLETQNAVISTLGGAYASIGNAKRARIYAKKQLKCAERMGNKRLIIISYIYITYYYLATKKFNIANKRLRAISADVVSSNDIFAPQSFI